MGGGASSQAAFEQMLACTMILGEAMVAGLDPRYVRFPDMYRLYDFHVGPKKHQQRNFQGGQMVLFVHNTPNSMIGDDGDEDDEDEDGSGAIQRLRIVDSNGTTIVAPSSKASKPDEPADSGPSESDEKFLVVYVSGDKIVLDKTTLNQPNNDGWTPLHACCHTLNAQEAGITILKELVDRNENLNMATRRGPGSFSCGWTPLHIAVAYGLEALALKLIRAGADVNTKNTVGWTPLYDACHRGYSTVARELLKAGAKHDVICPEFALCPYPGQHPLAEAARQGAVDTVKVLLEWGVDKNAVNSLGWTALHEAAYHNRLPVVKLLVVYGADVLVKTQKGSLAKDVTISSEIRSMLDDLSKDAPPPPASPKKEKIGQDEDDGEAQVKPSSPKRSPAKVAKTAPISRKEEYALLGDLPSLEARTPSIAVRDAQEDRDDDDDRGPRDEETKDDETTKANTKSKRKHRRAKREKDVPDEFKCAVTRKLLKDPLRSPYGHVFERQVVEAWFRDFGNRCPLTGQPLAIGQLTPDEKLKNDIRDWKRGTQKPPTVSPDEEVDEQHPAKSQPESAVSTAPTDDPYDF